MKKYHQEYVFQSGKIGILKESQKCKILNCDTAELMLLKPYQVTVNLTMVFLKVARNSFQHLYFDGSLQPLFIT